MKKYSDKMLPPAGIELAPLIASDSKSQAITTDSLDLPILPPANEVALRLCIYTCLSVYRGVVFSLKAVR